MYIIQNWFFPLLLRNRPFLLIFFVVALKGIFYKPGIIAIYRQY